MKAIILAAGYATRLYPLTQNFPKPLLEVGSKTILDWLIDGLEGTVDEFAVVLVLLGVLQGGEHLAVVDEILRVRRFYVIHFNNPPM